MSTASDVGALPFLKVPLFMLRKCGQYAHHHGVPSVYFVSVSIIYHLLSPVSCCLTLMRMTLKPALRVCHPSLPHTAGLSASMRWLGTRNDRQVIPRMMV